MAAFRASMHIQQFLCSVVEIPVVSGPFARGVDLKIDCYHAFFASDTVSGIEFMRDAIYLSGEYNNNDNDEKRTVGEVRKEGRLEHTEVLFSEDFSLAFPVYRKHDRRRRKDRSKRDISGCLGYSVISSHAQFVWLGKMP